MEIITTGFNFNIERFNSNIKKHNFLNKPRGGLWGSPVNSEFGWIDWCNSEDFTNSDTPKLSFKWKFTEDAKILKIDSKEDYLKALKKFKVQTQSPYFDSRDEHLDWWRVSCYYDGFHLSYKGFRELKNNFSWGISSWDCESIVAFKLEKIILL
jgi:hypothetical protein